MQKEKNFKNLRNKKFYKKKLLEICLISLNNQHLYLFLLSLQQSQKLNEFKMGEIILYFQIKL